MLTEQVAASIGAAFKAPSTSVSKDASIVIFEVQPVQARRSEFKRSATLPNCLAVSPSHVYAAQADKALVNVYNRDKESLEATIPFKERVTSLALACQGTVLVMGTEQGRLYIWETHTGRQLSTPQAHLQSITALVVESGSNFVITGSLDAAVHVWSLPALLSFSAPSSGSAQHAQNAPIKTLTAHRNAITALTLGHSASFCNFSVSASRDNTCVIWDYHTETILRTVLLPSSPLCLALDPADRALYAGFEDGSIQSIDLTRDTTISILDATSDKQGATIQPDPNTRWTPRSGDNAQTAQSLSISYDGTKLLSGHASGKILVWDVATGTFLSTLTSPVLTGPVTNLIALDVTGFTSHEPKRAFNQPTIVKPRFGDYDLDNVGRGVSAAYTLSVQYTSHSSAFDQKSEFKTALTHPCFPAAMLQDSILDLSTWTPATMSAAASNSETEFISLTDDNNQAPETNSRDKETERLRQQVASLQRITQKSLEQMDLLRREKKELVAAAAAVAAGRRDADDEEGIASAEDEWRRLGR